MGDGVRVPPLRTLYCLGRPRRVARRDFRIVASTISAARTLGGCSPVAMIASSLRKSLELAPPQRGVSVSTSRSAGDKLFRRAIVLQEFRHDILADHEIGQDDRVTC